MKQVWAFSQLTAGGSDLPRNTRKFLVLNFQIFSAPAYFCIRIQIAVETNSLEIHRAVFLHCISAQVLFTWTDRFQSLHPYEPPLVAHSGRSVPKNDGNPASKYLSAAVRAEVDHYRRVRFQDLEVSRNCWTLTIPQATRKLCFLPYSKGEEMVSLTWQRSLLPSKIGRLEKRESSQILPLSTVRKLGFYKRNV